MTLIDLRTGKTTHTSQMSLAELSAVLVYIEKGASTEWWRIHGGAPDTIRRLFCRAFRLRAAAMKWCVPDRTKARLNTVDPPRCRCGKRGTRIIGSETFCLACGPTTDAQRRANWNHDRHAAIQSVQSADFERRNTITDKIVAKQHRKRNAPSEN